MGIDTHVLESDYDEPYDSQRRRPAIPFIHDNDDRYELPKTAEVGLGSVIDVNESDYDTIDDSPQRLPSLSGIYDEIEFNKLH